MSSGLYGIIHSNRSDDKHWGKNCFNSSFPTALACYMMDNDVEAIYVYLEKNTDGNLVVKNKTIPISEVFNSGTLKPRDLYFDFESIYEPYNQYAYQQVNPIDLVVRNNNTREPLSPLEVKLTVMPDNPSSKRTEDMWGSELVVRPATTSYCAFGMFDSVKYDQKAIRSIFESTCSSIRDWKNTTEIISKMHSLCECINNFQSNYYKHQKPLLMQPIWKTKGQSPLLADNAFDIVVWSDYAFSRLFIDYSDVDSKNPPTKVDRPQRATVKLVRALWELSKSDKLSIDEIYKDVTYDKQSDKEFSRNGLIWRNYVTIPRSQTPIFPKGIVKKIIKRGHFSKLKPERRLDQTLYFTKGK